MSPDPTERDRPDDWEDAAVSTETYTEMLHVPLRWWALLTMFLASVLLAFLVATPTWVAFAVTAALTLLAVTVLLAYGAARVVVDDRTFRAGRAHIPVRLLGTPVALDAQASRLLAGMDADARAYLLLRPYVKKSVQVPVADPDDPTPYWLVSTRHPERLAQALVRSGAGIGVRPGTGAWQSGPVDVEHEE
jgi:Protein of unknown function (DUF3093)